MFDTLHDRLRSGDWLTARVVHLGCIALVLSYVITLVVTYLGADNMVLDNGVLLGSDYFCFWVAGQLANAGRLGEIYDHVAFVAAQKNVVALPYDYFFFYPPHFLLVLMPFAALGYALSYVAFMFVTFALAAWLVYVLRPTPFSIVGAMAVPFFSTNLFYGQNGFLTMALLGFGLSFSGRRPVAAGLAIAALTIKPQLGLLVPFVLIMDRHWTAFVAACLGIVALLGATWFVFGSDVFTDFIASSGKPLAVLREGALGWANAISAYSAARLAGLGDTAGWVVQAICSAAALGIGLYVCWRSPESLRDLRNAVVVVCTLLITPYALLYDGFAAVLALVWLIQSMERDGALPWEKALLMFVVLAPLVTKLVAEATGISVGFVSMVTLLGLLLRRWHHMLHEKRHAGLS
jgi:hypothetical protein